MQYFLVILSYPFCLEKKKKQLILRSCEVSFKTILFSVDLKKILHNKIIKYFYLVCINYFRWM